MPTDSGGAILKRDPIVQRGSILVYRVFDVAHEIDLKRVESLMQASTTGSGNLRVGIARRGRSAIIIRNAPVRLQLGKTAIKIFSETVMADTFATLWDYGAISIVFQLPITPGLRWSELIPRGAALNGEIPGAEEIDSLARQKTSELVQLLGTAAKRPTQPGQLFEDYLIYFFEELQDVGKADTLAIDSILPELILGEGHEVLAERSRTAVREYVYQYAETDLVALDWNSAVVLEPSGGRDIPDVIEFALTHLLELRYYDDLLDRRLNGLYDSIEVGRRDIWRSGYAQIAREANTLYLEMSELLERIDNSLKGVGDFYLAVIFRAAIRRLRVSDWQVDVSRKMDVISEVSELLQGEINVQRGHTMELVVIVLIAFEIISAVVRGIH
jgi:hypothetical protein